MNKLIGLTNPTAVGKGGAVTSCRRLGRRSYLIDHIGNEDQPVLPSCEGGLVSTGAERKEGIRANVYSMSRWAGVHLHFQT